MTKKNMYVDKSIDILSLDKELSDLLKSKGIETVENVWVLNRQQLKSLGLKDPDIKQIIIKLQLLGLDLNKRVYS